MEGRVAFSIPGLDPSMLGNNNTTTADGSKNKSKGDNTDGLGDISLTLAAAFSGDSTMAAATSREEDVGSTSTSKRGGRKKDKKKSSSSSPGDGGGGITAADDLLGQNEAI